ncbi:unnamed protein product, partial [Leptidea sinapis]
MKQIVYLSAILAIAAAQNAPAPLQARVRISDPFNDNQIQGNLTFTQLDEHKVRVEGVIAGLPPGHVSRIDFVDSMISLYGPHCILGRAVVLHEKQDDYGRGRHPDSRKTGNAGGRAACGVIGI